METWGVLELQALLAPSLEHRSMNQCSKTKICSQRKKFDDLICANGAEKQYTFQLLRLEFHSPTANFNFMIVDVTVLKPWKVMYLAPVPNAAMTFGYGNKWNGIQSSH